MQKLTDFVLAFGGLTPEVLLIALAFAIVGLAGFTVHVVHSLAKDRRTK